MTKNLIIISLLLLLTNCGISSSAFLGPVYTGAKTGSVYQTSLSYSSGKVVNTLNPKELINKINKKNDILVFVHANKFEKLKKLKKRKNFNKNILNNFRKIQLPLDFKKKKSQFIINNNFKRNSAKSKVSKILKEIL